MVDLLYEAFMNALEDQVSSEPRAAVLLGGFDSSLVAAGLARLGKKVETFSYKYEDARYNQPHTDTLSNFLDIRHHDVVIDAQTIADGLLNYPSRFNFPTNWPNYVIQTLKVAERIRDEGLRYCYTGDGCDGIFMGYPLTFKRSRLIGLLGRSPELAKKLMLGAVSWPVLDRWLGRPYTVLMGVLRAACRPHPERHVVTLQAFDHGVLRRLRLDAPPQEAELEETLRQLAAPLAELGPEQLAYKGKNMVSPGNNKMVAVTESAGLVLTSPYMHASMAEFASQMPTRFLRPAGSDTNIGKYILSRMAEKKGLLPREIIYQNKVGATDAPLETWYPGPLQPVLRQLVEALPFETSAPYIDAFFRPRSAEKAYGRLLGRQTNNITYLQHGISLLATYGSFSRALRS
ncbi:MAG: asparagine synthase C-terminal domain-containing protein [Acidobacteriota bacterium]